MEFSETRRAPFRAKARGKLHSSSDMFFVVGLGNPGKKYEGTRHNAGFMALDALEKENSLLNIHLLKPNTFMNNSGIAVKKELKKLKLKAQDLIVVHDDIDLPLGTIKVSTNRGSAGHKGVQSIIEALGTKNFTRIRIGIQPMAGKPENVESFVLRKFTKDEREILKSVMKNFSNAIEKAISGHAGKSSI